MSQLLLVEFPTHTELIQSEMSRGVLTLGGYWLYAKLSLEAEDLGDMLNAVSGDPACRSHSDKMGFGSET